MTNSVSEHFRRSMPSTVCHHFSRLLQCSTYYINADNSIRFAFAHGQPYSSYDDSDLLGALFSDEKLMGRPAIKAARPGEVYIAIDLFDNGIFYGRLAAGPIMDIAKTQKSGKPSDNFDNAVSAAILLYNFVYDEWIDENELREVCLGSRSASNIDELKHSQAAASRQSEPSQHHSICFENRLFSLITDGDEKGLLEMIKAPPDGAYGLLDREHPLRSLKNDCICTITLATRAAIAGGLDSETAFSQSDEAIQSLELHRNIDSLYQLIVKTLCNLTEMVAGTKRLGYTYRINRCRSYVINHIYEKLTVAELAAYLRVSPEYLSEQFRKETGSRLIDFIQLTRAEEAKKLLQYSNNSILEITSILNYHDQSHFTKSFRRAFGITPKRFRDSVCKY